MTMMELLDIHGEIVRENERKLDAWKERMNNMINVNFGTIPETDDSGLMNAMWASVVVGDTEIELYATDPIPDGMSNDEGDFLGDSYLRLMAEIDEQAEEFGVDLDRLVYPFD